MSEVVSLLVEELGITELTMWAISVLSTLPERLLLFAGSLGILILSTFAVHRIASPSLRLVLPAVISFSLFSFLYVVFPFHEYPFPVSGYVFPGVHPIATSFVLALFVAADSWRSWPLDKHGRDHLVGVRIASVCIAVLVSGLAVLLLNGWALRGLAQKLHFDPAVQQFAKGDFNWLEYDDEHRLLFASGHGTTYLLAFSVEALDTDPRRSQVDVDGAQSFAFSPEHQELYVLNGSTKTLFFLDAATLAPKRSYTDVGITSGDVFMSWDKTTDQIFIASEEPEDGSPTVAVDRRTGHVRSIQFTAYNMYQDPARPRLYLSLEEELVAYDTVKHKLTARFDARRKYLERMAMSPDQRELLVAAPVESAVWRLKCRDTRTTWADRYGSGCSRAGRRPPTQLAFRRHLNLEPG